MAVPVEAATDAAEIGAAAIGEWLEIGTGVVAVAAAPAIDFLIAAAVAATEVVAAVGFYFSC